MKPFFHVDPELSARGVADAMCTSRRTVVIIDSAEQAKRVAAFLPSHNGYDIKINGVVFSFDSLGTLQSPLPPSSSTIEHDNPGA